VVKKFGYEKVQKTVARTGITPIRRIDRAAQVRADQAQGGKPGLSVQQNRLGIWKQRARAGRIIAGRAEVELGRGRWLGLVAKVLEKLTQAEQAA